MPAPSYCRGCGDPIRWTVTEGRKRLAVDLEPHPSGNTAVSRDGRGVWLSRRPTEDLPCAPYERMHKPHVATCRALNPEPEQTACLGLIDLPDDRQRARGTE